MSSWRWPMGRARGSTVHVRRSRRRPSCPDHGGSMIRKAAALFLTFTAVPLTAQSFEGTVTMNMVSDNGDAHAISYMIKGSKIRFDVGGGMMSVIMDPVAQRMMVIMNAQKMYTERDFGRAAAAVQQQVAGKNPAVVR